MEGGVLSKVVLPLSLFIVMFGLGLGLVVDDFKKISRFPKAFFIGISCQLFLLPVIAFILCITLKLDPPIAIGLMVLSLCPGGVTSNLYSYLAKGNVALSISLTAIVSLITPFTIPFILGWNISYFLNDSLAIEIPIGKTILTLVFITIIPVSIGMLVNKKFPNFAKKSDSIVKILSLVLLFLIIGALVAKNWENIPIFFAQAGIASLLLNTISMLLGFIFAKLLLEKEDEITSICIEVGMQNGTTGLFITATLLDNPSMSIPPSVYSLIMFVTGTCFAIIKSKQSKA